MKVVLCKSFLTCWGWNANAVLADVPDACLLCISPVLYDLRRCSVALRCFIAPLLSSFPQLVGFQLQWAKSTYFQGEKVRPSFRALGERPAYFLISLWCNSPSFLGFTFPGQIPLPMSLTVGHLKLPDKDKSCHEVSFNIGYVMQISYTRELPYSFNVAR